MFCKFFILHVTTVLGCFLTGRVIDIHEPTNHSAPAVCNGRVGVACRQEPARRANNLNTEQTCFT